MCKLFIILPCYNEEENIDNLILECLDTEGKLHENGYDLIIMPIDDGSTDTTKEKLFNWQKKSNKILPLIHENNMGLGAGVMTGLTAFYNKSSDRDLAVIMDADNTHKPQYIISMIQKLNEEGLDCIIASRYLKSSKTIGVPLLRLFLSYGALFYYSIVLKVRNVKDYTCGYRLYSHAIIQKAFEKYGENFVTERSFACMMEVLYKLSRISAKFGEVPFELRYDDKRGASKMRILKTTFNSIIVALKLRFKK